MATGKTIRARLDAAFPAGVRTTATADFVVSIASEGLTPRVRRRTALAQLSSGRAI